MDADERDGLLADRAALVRELEKTKANAKECFEASLHNAGRVLELEATAPLAVAESYIALRAKHPEDASSVRLVAELRGAILAARALAPTPDGKETP